MRDLATKSKSIANLKSFGAKAKPLIKLRGEDVAVHGEDAEAFDALYAAVKAELNPKGLIERLWVQDFVFLHWEVLRYRRLKSRLLSLGSRGAMMRILINIDEPLNTDHNYDVKFNKITNDWMEGNKEAVQYINTTLERDGGGQDAVAAQALAMNLDKVECIDRLMMAAEQRRDRMLRDLEERRADIAVPLARIVDQPKHAAGKLTMGKK